MCSQEPGTVPYQQPNESNSHHHTLFIYEGSGSFGGTGLQLNNQLYKYRIIFRNSQEGIGQGLRVHLYAIFRM
jgi:hypothetical protein